jgi:glycosyltransferase involved in cell wall biosynthesis
MYPHRNNKKVIAVLPAYNAAKTLQQTVDAIPKEWIDEIILVDDYSTDNTAEVARSLGLHTIVHDKNKGYGGNQKTCYKEALRLGADIAVMIHPDFQYDPYYIPELIRPLAFDKADVSLGSRMMIKHHALKGGMPWWKFIANIGLTFVENMVLGLWLSEYHTGFRAYNRKALEILPFELNSDDFVFDSEIIVQARIAGLRFSQTPIETKYFPEASMIGFQRSVKYGFAILDVMRKYLFFKLGLLKTPQFAIEKHKYAPALPLLQPRIIGARQSGNFEVKAKLKELEEAEV